MTTSIRLYALKRGYKPVEQSPEVSSCSISSRKPKTQN